MDANRWISVAAGVLPATLAFVARFRRDARDESQVQRIKRFIDLLDQIPDDAKPPLDELIKREVASFAEKQTRRSTRKLNGPNMAALVIVGSITAFFVWGCTSLALNVHGAWWVGTALFGALGLAFMGVGVGQLYKYPPAAGAGGTGSGP
ncbi:hypothetical protein LQ424_23260 [Rhodococcus qingshengii]|uniref:hypothetical protein n=1 Tax=Rhodococcus qingshengii TaxID=334542 RepID=UPI001E32A98A|nr:hypothetical protein [Rhodococcus qingshengii]MCD2134735.1 hypothetical protein [Rhodococcus qingshengii]